MSIKYINSNKTRSFPLTLKAPIREYPEHTDVKVFSDLVWLKPAPGAFSDASCFPASLSQSEA